MLVLCAGVGQDWNAYGPRQGYAAGLLELEQLWGKLSLLDGKSKRTRAEEARLAELALVPYMFGVIDDFIDQHADQPPRERGLYRTLVSDAYASTLTWRELSRYPLLAIVHVIRFGPYVLRGLAPEHFAAVPHAAPSLPAISTATPAPGGDAPADRPRWFRGCAIRNNILTYIASNAIFAICPASAPSNPTSPVPPA